MKRRCLTLQRASETCMAFLSAVLGIYRPDFTLRTDLPNKVRPSIYVPTDKEVETLIKRVSGTQMEIPVLLAAFGPMRRSEICALTSDQIDGNIVHVDRAIVLNENYQWVIKKPKLRWRSLYHIPRFCD